MRIPWLRATLEGAEPLALPVLCIVSAATIAISAIATAIAFSRGQFVTASVSSIVAAATSLMLLYGVHETRLLELRLEKLRHDVDAAGHQAAMARLQREQLTRDMARYQTATTSERRH